MPYALVAAKTVSTLEPFAAPVSDAALVNERIDGEAFADRTLRHAVLVGVRLIRCELRNVDFSHSWFDRCYFRRCTFENCDFTDCRFEGTEFIKSRFVTCEFPYTKWTDTSVDIQEIIPSLPYHWPNVNHRVLESLRLNALSQGDGLAARSCLFKSMAAKRVQLKEMILQRKSWYKKRYGLKDRIGAGAQLVWSYLERWVWGYGERPLLALGWGLGTVVVFGFYYFRQAGASGVSLDLGAALRLSAGGFSGGVLLDGSAGAGMGLQGALALEGMLGLIYIGVLAAVVYRWISIRAG